MGFLNALSRTLAAHEKATTGAPLPAMGYLPTFGSQAKRRARVSADGSFRRATSLSNSSKACASDRPARRSTGLSPSPKFQHSSSRPRGRGAVCMRRRIICRNRWIDRPQAPSQETEAHTKESFARTNDFH